MAARLGVRYDEMSIVPMFDAFNATLAEEFAGLPSTRPRRTFQARIRGTLLMALSNKFGSIVLTTGNKSEMATGYCTLYGDMAGGLRSSGRGQDLVIGWRRGATSRAPRSSRAHHHAPAFCRTAARPEGPGQPAALRGAGRHPGALHGAGPVHRRDRRGAGFAPTDVERVTRGSSRSTSTNAARRRSGVRLTHRGFGRDWRYPITSEVPRLNKLNRQWPHPETNP